MTTTVMPLAAGLFEEGVGQHSPYVTQRTCNARWEDMQAVKGGPILSNTAVDQFIARGYTGRCRIFMGRYSPQFALDAGKVHVWDPTDGNEADVPRWWEADVQALQKDFLTKFAAKYDGKVSAIFLANGGTIYAEPFIRGLGDVRTRQSLLNAGYTPDADKASYVAGYSMCKVFKFTRIAQAFNPWQYVDANGNQKVDVTFTIEMMDKIAAMFPRRAIWQNNSIRTPQLGGQYGTMYDYMAQKHVETGRPISFQCAIADRIGDWKTTLEWAVHKGAHAVELSPGFSNFLTSADLQIIDKALRANAA